MLHFFCKIRYIHISIRIIRADGPETCGIGRAHCPPGRPRQRSTVLVRACLKKLLALRSTVARIASSSAFEVPFSTNLARLGRSKRTIYDRFGGRTAVQTKKARPLRNTGRSDRIRRPSLPRATQKRPKIVPEASRERLSEKHAPKSRLGTSWAHFSVAPGRLGSVPGVSVGAPGAYRASPSASRSVPGASPKPPESRQVARRLPGAIWIDFRTISGRRSDDFRTISPGFLSSIPPHTTRAA